MAKHPQQQQTKQAEPETKQAEAEVEQVVSIEKFNALAAEVAELKARLDKNDESDVELFGKSAEAIEGINAALEAHKDEVTAAFAELLNHDKPAATTDSGLEERVKRLEMQLRHM